MSPGGSDRLRATVSALTAIAEIEAITRASCSEHPSMWCYLGLSGRSPPGVSFNVEGVVIVEDGSG